MNSLEDRQIWQTDQPNIPVKVTQSDADYVILDSVA